MLLSDRAGREGSEPRRLGWENKGILGLSRRYGGDKVLTDAEEDGQGGE